MKFDTNLQACAALVEKADPERFRATMAAPIKARAKLFPLYAFNVEVSRAPWVTQEPMIAEMRLQWWRDALEEIADGKQVRKHEVTEPLAQVLTPDMARALDALIAARRWDIYKEPFENEEHFDAYITQTSATLMQVSAQALGARPTPDIASVGFAAGIAGWLRAVPELEDRGRIPLLDGTHEGLRVLGRQALAILDKARKTQIDSAARPALLSGWQTEYILRQAVREPARVADGALGMGALRSSAALMRQSLTGRF